MSKPKRALIYVANTDGGEKKCVDIGWKVLLALEEGYIVEVKVAPEKYAGAKASKIFIEEAENG